MFKRLKAILLVVQVVLMPLVAEAAPFIYSAKEIHGQVVDEETGQPLEGVVIVASWVLHNIGLIEGHTGGTMNILETVTDKDGKYFFPSWGPRLRPPLSYLYDRDPELRLFKSNYYPKGLANSAPSDSMTRTSEWDGKVIKLKPFKGDDWDDWDKYTFQIYASWASESADCLRECPRYVLALDAESKRIKMLAPKGVIIPGQMNPENFYEGNREFLLRYKQEHLMKDKDEK